MSTRVISCLNQYKPSPATFTACKHAPLEVKNWRLLQTQSIFFLKIDVPFFDLYKPFIHAFQILLPCIHSFHPIVHHICHFPGWNNNAASIAICPPLFPPRRDEHGWTSHTLATTLGQKCPLAAPSINCCHFTWQWKLKPFVVPQRVGDVTSYRGS